MKLIIILLIIIKIYSVNVYGNSFNTSEIEEAARQEANLSYNDIFNSIIKGDITEALSEIGNSFLNMLTRELKANYNSIKSIVIISLICGIMNTVSLDLKDKAVSELVFYIGQVIILTISIAAFKEGISVLKEAVNAIINIIRASIPLMIGVVAASGKSVASLTSGGILTSATLMISGIIKGIIIPLIIFTTLINIVNLISKKTMISKLSALFKEATIYIIKGGGYGFIFLMTLQRIGGGSVNKVVGSGLKSLVGAVPVVGDVVKGSADVLASTASAVASASGVAIVFVIIGAALVPVIKIAVIMGLYKVVAAIVEPICDKYTVEIIDTIGEGSKLILATLFMIVFMFIVSTLVILGGL